MARSHATRRFGRFPAFALIAVLMLGCGVRTWDPVVSSPDEAIPSNAGDDVFLKVHLLSGELYVLDRWSDPAEGEALRGAGTLYDVERIEQRTGQHTIPLSEIALLV